MGLKNNSNKLASIYKKRRLSIKIRYPDLKPNESEVRYFKEVVIPEENNYNFAMTTLPYINPPKNIESDKPERDLKVYKNQEETTTVGAMPARLQTFYKYSD